jgi:hypothetical protein
MPLGYKGQLLALLPRRRKITTSNSGILTLEICSSMPALDKLVEMRSMAAARTERHPRRLDPLANKTVQKIDKIDGSVTPMASLALHFIYEPLSPTHRARVYQPLATGSLSVVAVDKLKLSVAHLKNR